jgi:hypothetical protein
VRAQSLNAISNSSVAEAAEMIEEEAGKEVKTLG